MRLLRPPRSQSHPISANSHSARWLSARCMAFCVVAKRSRRGDSTTYIPCRRPCPPRTMPCALSRMPVTKMGVPQCRKPCLPSRKAWPPCRKGRLPCRKPCLPSTLPCQQCRMPLIKVAYLMLALISFHSQRALLFTAGFVPSMLFCKAVALWTTVSRLTSVSAPA